jgi:fused signal recognition particle receptor
MLKFFRRKKNDGTTPEDPNKTQETAGDAKEEELVPSQEETELSAPVSQTDIPETQAIENENKAEPPVGRSWFSRLKESLKKTRDSFTEGIASLFLGQKEIDEHLLEKLETHLLSADVGVEATQYIIQTLTQKISRKELKDASSVFSALQKLLVEMLMPCEVPLKIDTTQKPFVILMIGVNGAGKTTTIGKLAKKFQQEQLSVMLAAGDTFRAAAVEQLQVWGDRNNVPVLAQHTGADSASVIFDAFQSAKAKALDVLIADTAGRLHTRDNLMDELKKVKRVIQKLDPNAPHEVMLVLDSGMGQNALVQAQKFHEALNVTGLVLTKLDGTAKGGIIFAIANKLKLPIRFIGVGETTDDLRTFEAQAFVNALFDQNGNQES